MRLLFLLMLVFSGLLTKGEKIHLNYAPKGKIICFHWDSLTIYTDTTALFAVYDQYGNKTPYDQRVKNFVRKSIRESKTDTTIFKGEFIPFNDGNENKYQQDWYVEWPLIRLLKQGKLKIYDRHQNLVKTVVTKKTGTKRKRFVKRSYLNKETGEELMKEILYFVSITPSF